MDLASDPISRFLRALRSTTRRFEAVKLLEPARPGDAIYAITGGGYNSSHISEADAKRRLMQRQIRLFLFLFALPVEVQLGAEDLRELARDTGGSVFSVLGRRSLGDFGYEYDKNVRERITLYTRSLNIQVNGFYTLELDTPLSASKSSKVSLEVVDGSGKVRKGVTWAYQSAYQSALPTQHK